MRVNEAVKALENGDVNELFGKLYKTEAIEEQKSRYVNAINEFVKLYGDDRDISIMSVSGRSEISGNHTDHNHGKVLAASIDLDIIAIVSKRDDSVIRVKSEGFPVDEVNIENPAPAEADYFTSKAIIMGMCGGFLNNGYKIGGFDAYTTSNVFKGSGLSSSAAFEDMIGFCLSELYNSSAVDNVTIAKLSQYAENVYFGKPCGLMDQVACAVGGFVAIDFENPAEPKIEKLDFNLTEAGYSLCIVNTKGNHADLNADYAAVPTEMKKVAQYFGKSVLREISITDVLNNIKALREYAGDRAILRACHFFAENERVSAQAKALREGNIEDFFDSVIASGNSSFKYLQNIYSPSNTQEQGLSLALCIAGGILDGIGACRVHGGGFAGTIQAFVPNEKVDEFKSLLNFAFGDDATTVLKVRPYGTARVL